MLFLEKQDPRQYIVALVLTCTSRRINFKGKVASTARFRVFSLVEVEQRLDTRISLHHNLRFF